MYNFDFMQEFVFGSSFIILSHLNVVYFNFPEYLFKYQMRSWYENAEIASHYSSNWSHISMHPTAKAIKFIRDMYIAI